MKITQEQLNEIDELKMKMTQEQLDKIVPIRLGIGVAAKMAELAEESK